MDITMSKDDLIPKLAKIVKAFFKQDTPIIELARFVSCCMEEFDLSNEQRRKLMEMIVDETENGKN